MTRTLTSLCALVTAGLISGLAGLSGASAQSVPLPRPAPFAKSGTTNVEPLIVAQARPTPPGMIAPAPSPVRPNAPAGKLARVVQAYADKNAA